MCTHHYEIFSCGHSFHHITCSPPSQTSFIPNDGGQNQHWIFYEPCLSRHQCDRCKIGILDPQDPYLQNLPTIVGILGQALSQVVEEQGTNMPAMEKAKLVVGLLKRLVDLYGACVIKRPEREEMRVYVVLGLRCVGVVLGKGARRGDSAWNENAITQGLDYLSLYPQKGAAEQNGLALDANSTVAAGVNGAFLPLLSTPALTVPDMGNTFGASLAMSEERPVIGRDDWDCDFCGPECFCEGLED
jgi:hypothetical protein